MEPSRDRALVVRHVQALAKIENGAGETIAPAVSIYETEAAFVVAADMPGADWASIRVRADAGSLTIGATLSGDATNETREQLIVTAVNQEHSAQEHVAATLSNLSSDRFAVEFEFRFFEADPDIGRCILELYGDGGSHTPVIFFANGDLVFAHEDSDRQPIEDFSTSRYDTTKTNTVTLILLGNRIAAFVNGQLAHTALDPTGSSVYNIQALAAQLGIRCEYDNYKIWGLSGVDFNPCGSLMNMNPFTFGNPT